MALLKVYKVIATLPTPLEADSIYLVRVGAGYDMYVTDTTGAIAYASNSGGGSGGGDTLVSEGALINSATAKATPVDADQLGLMDSAASNVLKKLSWANVKVTLKTYFDSLYQPIGSGGGGGGSAGVHGALIRTGTSTSYIVNCFSSYSQAATVNNRLSAVPFIPIKSFTSSALYINCATLQAGAIARILIYSELDGRPDQKLYESADLSLSTAGIKTASTSFTFNAGTTYFICTHTQGTAQVTVIPIAAVMPVNMGGVSVPTTLFTSVSPWPVGSAPTTFGPGNSLFQAPFLVGITAA